MSFLEKLGLGQKKKELSPLIGEKKKKEQEKYSLKRNPYIRFAIVVFFIGISAFSLPHNPVNSGLNYTTGQPWRNSDLTAPFDFAIKKTATELEEERREIRETTPPIFRVDNNVPITIQTRLDSLYREIQPVLENYHVWQSSKNDRGLAPDDSLQFYRSLEESNIDLTDASWEILLESYHQVQQQNLSPNQFEGIQVKQQLESLIDQLMNQGIINRNKSTLNIDKITLRNTSESTEQSIDLSRVRDLREANEFMQFRLNQGLDEQRVRLALELYNKVISPNYKYNEEDTQSRLQEELSRISETTGAIAQGQVIIRRGDMVTSEKANILESLAEARSQNATQIERWIRFGGQLIIIIAVTFVFFMYIYLYRRNITSDNALFFLVFLTLGLVSLAAGLINYFDIANPYIIPVAIAPIILTIIFDSRVGLVSSIMLASLLGLVNGNSFEFVIATFAACSLGVFSVRDIRDRSQFFFTTPGIVLLTYMLILGSFSITALKGWEQFGSEILYVLISSVFILFTYPMILLFEKVFGVTTDFTLIELGDTNQPLLKELMNKAPGTFHHSLQVANLSEAAASAIGANALLCRVGALYHDIGKMVKPEYFVENQSKGGNEHDKLKPQMSAMVIKAHVSEGVKMAEKADLPEIIIDFIKTHHGTSVIRYFFEKAKEDENLKSMLQEDQFRYEGPLPSTKETGILLLADGIEAASRAMKNPTYSKLENLVNRMVDDRVAEGQLSHCPLTFRHLQVIKETFLNILVGVYHSRVEYPEDKEREAEEKAKGSAKKEKEHTEDISEETLSENGSETVQQEEKNN
ncbi:HD family phosphohydrolase [Gracilimonas tropica]|uniref:HD family phosphohydrolase n=1 Tax=Gracilimonas tropica TaxID=454600 RepID=UPI000366B8F4|nr:HDIG domain-containing metalloprotein [Gracilimonas tropica]